MIWLLIIISVKSSLGLEVVSTNKPAYQISTPIHDSLLRVPGLAVDGNTDPDYYGGDSCSSTLSTSGPHPWWYVDLENIYSVSHVSIYTSTSESFKRRAADIEIRVGYDIVAPFSGNTKCGSNITEAMVLNENPVTMTCSHAISGQYVTLYRTAIHTDTDVLTLCEVEVYADTEAPVVTCPGDVNADTDPGQSTATVTWSDPTVTDNLDTNLTVTCAGSSPIDTDGSSFVIGETTVDCQSTDYAGKTGSCSFSVVISDNEGPTVTCPDDVSVVTDPGQSTATATWDHPVVSDNVDNDLSVTCFIGSNSTASGLSFAIGETIVSCNSTDNAGNTGSCIFSVEVEGPQANQSPVLTCPDDINQATVTWSVPVVSDNVDTDLSATCTPFSGSSFNAGSTDVTCSTVDTDGNKASCSFSVNIMGNRNAKSVPGYLIAVVVILCVIILVMSPAFIFFCRSYYSQKNKRMEHSTEMNMTDYDDVEVQKPTTNAADDTGYEIPLSTIGNDDAASPPKLQSQRRGDSPYEDPHTYMSVDPTYTDLKK